MCLWNQRDLGLRKSKWGKIEKLSVRLVSGIISNSNPGAEMIRGIGASIEAIRVIRNGVRLDEPVLTNAEWRQKLGVSETYFLAACWALHPRISTLRLTSWKTGEMRQSRQQPHFLVVIVCNPMRCKPWYNGVEVRSNCAQRLRVEAKKRVDHSSTCTGLKPELPAAEHLQRAACYRAARQGQGRAHQVPRLF